MSGKLSDALESANEKGADESRIGQIKQTIMAHPYITLLVIIIILLVSYYYMYGVVPFEGMIPEKKKKKKKKHKEEIEDIEAQIDELSELIQDKLG